MKSLKPIFAIVGPTASGKTELGVDLATRLGNAEIINCDSVQIYKEIKIATAKPTPEEMGGIPHHLLDYVAPHVNYTAADWARDAEKTVAEIESRGNTPILVGGTGFYLRTLREPLFESPPTDETLRARLRVIVERKGPEHIHKILQRVDPSTAKKLFPRDYVRTTRALEVFFQTGKKLSDLQPKRKDPPEFAARIAVFALHPPREELYDIIDKRTESHFSRGLVEEVKDLLQRGIPSTSNALGSHGYRRVNEYLVGERTIESAIERTKQDVRNYAKRQITWFKREKGVQWLNGFGSCTEIKNGLWELVRQAR